MRLCISFLIELWIIIIKCIFWLLDSWPWFKAYCGGQDTSHFPTNHSLFCFTSLSMAREATPIIPSLDNGVLQKEGFSNHLPCYLNQRICEVEGTWKDHEVLLLSDRPIQGWNPWSWCYSCALTSWDNLIPACFCPFPGPKTSIVYLEICLISGTKHKSFIGSEKGKYFSAFS